MTTLRGRGPFCFSTHFFAPRSPERVEARVPNIQI